MRSIKNTFMVSALSLGLIVGAVGVAGAATSTAYQQKIAEWIKNDPNPMVMNTNSGVAPAVAPAVAPTVAPAATPAVALAAAPAVAPAVTPVAAPVATPASTPATVPAKTVTPAPVTTGQPNQYHYNDGHSNMNPQQHQQLHNSMNGNGYENHNTNMSENHMSGSQSGHE